MTNELRLPAVAERPAATLPGRRIWSARRPAAVVALVALMPLMASGPGWCLQSDPAASAPDAVAAAPPVRRQSTPRVVGPRPGAEVAIRPLISEEDKARARQARADLRLRLAPAPAPRTPSARQEPPAHAAPAPQAPRAPQTSPPVAAPRAEPAFALTTRALRTRAEADQVLVAMRSLLRKAGGVQVDVLAQGDDWRVVGWPFARRADADQARALLVSRGMRVEVVGF